MFIQLLGLPGSGKTTVARVLARDYSERFASARFDPLTTKQLLLCHPAFVARSVLRLTPSLGPSLVEPNAMLGWRDRALPVVTLMNLLLAYEQLRRRPHDGRLVVFDEFVHQRALGIFGFGLEQPAIESVRRFLDALSPYRVPCVLLDVKPEVAYERASSRAEGVPRRLGRVDATQRLAVLRVQQRVLDHLVSLEPPSLVVHDAQTPSSAAEQVANHFVDGCSGS